jgi:hypothetical protein
MGQSKDQVTAGADCLLANRCGEIGTWRQGRRGIHLEKEGAMAKKRLSILVSLVISLSQPMTVLAAAGVEQIGNKSTYHCYKFNITNRASGKKITDLHFSVPGGAGGRIPAKYMRAPADWGAEIDSDGKLVFKTPVNSAPTSGTGAKPPENPIDTGKTLHGFRFCLPKKMDLTYSISYSDGSTTTPTDFGGVQIGGTVVHNYTLQCVKIRITAPDAAVYDVHFQSVDESNPHFDHVELPDKWSGGPSENGKTVDLDAGTNPIEPGKSVEIEMCFEHVPPRIAWKFTDKDHHDIPNAGGKAKLKP